MHTYHTYIFKHIFVLNIYSNTHIFDRQIERKREREISSIGSPSKWPSWPELGKAKAGSPNVYPGFPHRHRHPSSWANFCSFPGKICRDLDQNTEWAFSRELGSILSHEADWPQGAGCFFHFLKHYANRFLLQLQCHFLEFPIFTTLTLALS